VQRLAGRALASWVPAQRGPSALFAYFGHTPTPELPQCWARHPRLLGPSLTEPNGAARVCARFERQSR
jgi:hypothetical protein